MVWLFVALLVGISSGIHNDPNNLYVVRQKELFHLYLFLLNVSAGRLLLPYVILIMAGRYDMLTLVA